MGPHVKKKCQKAQQSTKEKLKLIKKERKQKLKEKRARLVVHNLPFEATKENLKEHFEKFGDITEIDILKKEDGKLVGCGFVQFNLVQKAAKAKHHLNGKTFLGREIMVDFALPKNKYKTEEEVVEIKQEDEIKVKQEPMDSDEVEEQAEEFKQERDHEEGENDDEAEENDNDEAETSDGKIEGLESAEVASVIEKKSKFESNDVVEGRTIFIKNVPFNATNEDLKECMKQYGPVYYALICIDKYTEHSKGTAFVKFVNPEDAEKTLNAGTELSLLGNVLDCHKALGRNELNQKTATQKGEKNTKKDSRNLYLVKEGVILAGSKAAESVSATDMAKRLQLEQFKTQMLRNLNMFVSRERLVVHNLPSNWDDRKFKILIQNSSPKNVVIKEARVMRDLKNVDESGLGRSKEFGFVTFAKHENALATLRTLNNNPDIFSAHRRPIVAFAIENRTKIKAKEKRLEKSRLKNPKCKNFDPDVVKRDAENKPKYMTEIAVDSGDNFVGVLAKPGVQKMRSKNNLKTQAKLHNEHLKKEKKRAKLTKKSLKEKRQDFTKQPKQKMNRSKETGDEFLKLVSNYKKKLLAPPDNSKKKKWYE